MNALNYYVNEESLEKSNQRSQIRLEICDNDKISRHLVQHTHDIWTDLDNAKIFHVKYIFTQPLQTANIEQGPPALQNSRLFSQR